MKNEYRTHTYGGIDRAGESRRMGPEPLATGNITIGELARESGVTLRALRFYQSKGLLAPHRDGGAHGKRGRRRGVSIPRSVTDAARSPRAEGSRSRLTAAPGLKFLLR